MKQLEKKLREELGLKPTTKIENSTRLQNALSFAQAHPGKKINLYESTDSAWGERSNRANEGIMDAKIIGVSGSPRSKQGYTYLWIYAYESKKCIRCNKLIMWGHNNPMAPICDDCKKKEQ